MNGGSDLEGLWQENLAHPIRGSQGNCVKPNVLENCVENVGIRFSNGKIQ